MFSFKSFDPKYIFPKLYRLGFYTLTVKDSGTLIQIQLNPDTEKRVLVSISDLLENFYDFEFKAQPHGQWELEIDQDIWNKIGRMFYPFILFTNLFLTILKCANIDS
jgi:hypothetical protein